MKLLQPLTVVGSFSFWVASNLLLNSLTNTLLSLMNMEFPIYCNSFLKDNAFWVISLIHSEVMPVISHLILLYAISFVHEKNNRSFIIASQYFLLCKQSNTTFIYDCQIHEYIFNPIAILWYKYEVLPKMVRSYSIF